MVDDGRTVRAVRWLLGALGASAFAVSLWLLWAVVRGPGG